MKKKLVNFKIVGPISIHPTPMAKAKTIDKIAKKRFLEDDLFQKVSNEIGCYVFGMKAGPGFTPYYVGKTYNSFAKECFTDHKLNHYRDSFMNIKKGSPVLFFVVLQRTPGPKPINDIEDLERFLIQVGYQKNPKLSNDQKKKEPRWSIQGIIRSKPGKVGHETSSFRKMMGIEKTKTKKKSNPKK